MSGETAAQSLREATLDALTGPQQVHLPHTLAPTDFPPTGGTVRYRLDWPLQAVPDRPQGVYVFKMALSGRWYVNGQRVGACGHAPLEVLRCLHLPQFFTVPPALLHVGSNTLEFEVYATARQMNGLSVVWVGDADALYEDRYVVTKWVTKDLQTGLAWLATLLGLLSMMVGLILRRKSVFIWFGLASLVNAVASLNGFVVHPWIDIDVYNWLIFSSRLVSVPLTFLTILGIFGKDDVRLIRILLAYSVLAPVLVWFGGIHRMFVFALYAPLVLACPVLMVYAARWTWRSRELLHAVSTLMLLAFFLGGLLDWVRLAGVGPFEGVYLGAYLYSGMMLAMGLVLVGRLAHALEQSQKLRALEIAEKDRAALQAHMLVQSRQQEREQLLRDIHDGFGSQLASLRMMVEKGRIPPSALAGYLQEVSADLHLVVDTLGQPDITLEESIYDKRYRIERRFAGSGLQFHWQVALDGLPSLSARTILQILRIVQEAMHNAIRHADAKNITVSAVYQQAEDLLLVSVQDDGVGMPAQPRHGRGIDNMRNRARQIGAQWHVRPACPGTVVELYFPHPGKAVV